VKRFIPVALTTLRLLLGPLALACAWFGWPRWLFAPILVIATASDIYDGVLARRFGVATPALRRYDSVTDLTYYLFILAATWLLCRAAIADHWLAVSALVASELATVAISLVRFRTFPATHSWLAKFYGLSLFGVVVALLVFDASGSVIVALAVVGLVTNAEIIAILCWSSDAPVDVPSIVRMRR
jgi:CDP-diacylglycerol--glycerol-3-phosphate 3-phosphatidyltransferase